MFFAADFVFLCVFCPESDCEFCVCIKHGCECAHGLEDVQKECVCGVYRVSGWPADEDIKTGAVRGQLKADRGAAFTIQPYT